MRFNVNFVISNFSISNSSFGLGLNVNNGDVAQLGEHLPCTQGVGGSNPLISTNKKGDTSPPSLFLPYTYTKNTTSSNHTM